MDRSHLWLTPTAKTPPTPKNPLTRQYKAPTPPVTHQYPAAHALIALITAAISTHYLPPRLRLVPLPLPLLLLLREATTEEASKAH